MQEEQHLNGKFERRTSIMNNKLHGKDLITIGIYTALYIVAIFVASVANVTPLTFMFYPAISSLLGAVFFIMLATKVQKFGAVIIWGVIVGLLYLVLDESSHRLLCFDFHLFNRGIFTAFPVHGSVFGRSCPPWVV